MYGLTISKLAMNFILHLGSETFQNHYALILADTHCCGGIISIEIGSDEVIGKDVNMQLLFPKETTGHPFHVYAEIQAIHEDAFPEEILIDLKKSEGTSVLEMKNGHFEKPYDEM